jgi:micrococcal nuclease
MRSDTLKAFIILNERFPRHWIGLILLFLTASVVCASADGWVRARWVADGDTIVLQDGRHVRYIGVDTPEIDHKNNRAEPMGYEARAMNRHLVDGWQLRLVQDREKKDRYGRILAYVYRRDGLFVNAEMLNQGCGYLLSRFPNISKEQELLTFQRDAMQHARGIWMLVRKDAQPPPHALLGNRRSRRFHAHNCPMGERISAKNRIWLENEWTAFWSGYSPAKECIVFPR